MSGWGLSPWGLGPWGLGFGLGIDYAYAAGDRFVRVKLSAPPLEDASTVAGSVYNPRTWQVTTPSTGRILTVLSVVKTGTNTYDILTLEEFDTHYVQMAVGTSTLKTAAGVPVGSLLTFGFAGVQLEATSTPQRKATTRGFAERDLANPPTPNSPVGGTLEVTSAGDYKPVEGPQLLRKLILRRLVSMRGDFFHLPEYGIGLREKEPLPVNDLVKLRKQIEQQIKLEPDAESANVALTYDYAASALIVQMQVRMKQTGQKIDVALPIPTGAVSQ